MINARSRIACWILVLAGRGQLRLRTGEPVGPASETALALQTLRELGDGEATAEKQVELLNRTTVGLLQVGQHTLAETFAREALALAERDLDQEHQETLNALNSLAVLYYEQGRYDWAEPLLVRVLQTRERTLGQDHPRTLVSLNSLAVL